MTPYATPENARTYGCLLSEDADVAEQWLRRASRDIDTLTFNRIPACGGLTQLTPFQREIVAEVCCRLAVFESENAELLDSAVTSYSINGVSASFGSGWGVTTKNGVVLPVNLYQHLSQTGLCVRTVMV
ncbi:MAG: hypothetical protein Q4F79_05625 [Eubacteriales bacterium]|nr:hypothetical protein [Eubacteriales bacterium]